MNNLRIIRPNSLCELLGIKPSTLYDWLSETSPRFDATMPKPVRLGKRAVGFKENEVMAWIASKQEA